MDGLNSALPSRETNRAHVKRGIQSKNVQLSISMDHAAINVSGGLFILQA